MPTIQMRMSPSCLGLKIVLAKPHSPTPDSNKKPHGYGSSSKPSPSPSPSPSSAHPSRRQTTRDPCGCACRITLVRAIRFGTKKRSQIDMRHNQRRRPLLGEVAASDNLRLVSFQDANPSREAYLDVGPGVKQPITARNMRLSQRSRRMHPFHVENPHSARSCPLRL